MTDRIGRTGDGNHSAATGLWAYGYEMMPPHLEDRMTAIRRLVELENGHAKREARSWTARLVTEERVTHLLIVSATPELDIEINRKLEAELSALGIRFLATAPMKVHGDPMPGTA